MKNLKSLDECWDAVNGITNLQQADAVEEQLKIASDNKIISNEEWDDLMEAVACQYRLIYHNK